MTDQVLDILKLVLLALLYLFFARVLWAVWSEVREPIDARVGGDYVPPTQAGQHGPSGRGRREPRPAKGRGGVPARLVVLEPKERRGTTFAITGTVSIGREAGIPTLSPFCSRLSSTPASIRASLVNGGV